MIRALLLALSLTVSAFGDFVNNGSLTNVVVDDPVFVNNGWFEVQAREGFTLLPSRLGLPPNTYYDWSVTPWDASRTRTYQNNGYFVGVSVRLDTVDPVNGNRTPAQRIENTASGVIDMANPLGLLSLATFGDSVLFTASLARLQANEIVNEGLIRAGTSGLILLRGNSIDLSFGTLAIDPLGYYRGERGFCGSTYTTDVNDNLISYSNDAGIYDIYWGTGSQTNLNVAAFVTTNPTGVFTYGHNVSTGGPQFPTSILLTDAMSWARTERLDATNVVVQAVFVETADTNITAEVQWIDLGIPNGRQIDKFYTAEVKIVAPLFDPLTLTVVTNSVVIWDMLGSTTNLNNVPQDATIFAGVTGSRPGAYFVSRCDVPILGLTSNAVVSPEMFWQPGFATTNPSNTYAGHSFRIDTLPSRPMPLEGVTAMDLPGRIEIEAPTLNLLRTGIRGEGMVSIVTDNLVSSQGAVVDSQNLNFNIARQSGPLRIENLSKDVVERLAGTVRMWSGVWTNLVTNQVTLEVETWAYHVTVVDATQVSSKQEVGVTDFIVRAPTTDLIISDNMIVSNRFEFAGQNLTLLGTNELRGTAWASTNLPNLRNFTNEQTGLLRLSGLAQFGTLERPLDNFRNAGTISSFSFGIDAQNVDISGTIYSGQRELFDFIFDPTFSLIVTNAGPISINAREAATLTGANLVTYGDINLSGAIYKLDSSTLYAGGAINLNVTTALQDSGLGAGNAFVVSNSFNLQAPVAYGNLLGSSVFAQPTRNRSFRLRWSMPDAGTTETAYRSSAALGRLVLNSDTNTVFNIVGTSAGRALYVDVLEIQGRGITNLVTLTNNLFLQTGIKLYYADVIAPELEDDARRENKTVAELLNGKVMFGGGTLVWVPTFLGESSGVDVARLNGTSVRMNRSLRESLIIDSDNDGIPNGLDAFPLDNQLPPIVMTENSGVRRAAVSFRADGNKSYVVESSPAVQGAAWSVVQIYQNTQPEAIQVTVTDAVAADDARRFYRVREQAGGGGEQ